MLTDIDFYKKILHLEEGWSVTKVELKELEKKIHVYVGYFGKEYVNTITGELNRIYDFRPERVWRHLDTCEYSTHIHCRIPRIQTSEGKIESVQVSWSAEDQRHTHLFENKVIRVLQASHNQTQSGAIMEIPQEKVNYIMHQAVKRGLERRDLKESEITQLCMDEKSYGKGQQYVTVLSEPVTGSVLDVSKGRDLKSVDTVLNKTLSEKTLEKVESVCCDMWDAFINGLKKTVQMQNSYMTNFILLNT